jgi:hypothetical protein
LRPSGRPFTPSRFLLVIASGHCPSFNCGYVNFPVFWFFDAAIGPSHAPLRQRIPSNLRVRCLPVGECGSWHVLIPRIWRKKSNVKTSVLRQVIWPASSHPRRSRRKVPGAHALRRPPACFRDAVMCRMLRQSERISGSGRFPWDFPARNMINHTRNYRLILVGFLDVAQTLKSASGDAIRARCRMPSVAPATRFYDVRHR